ncbi:MAG: flagellar hook-associated protein FlgL, partial [Gammaproteobacteria bacterium]|nr:flagellar hook-associated protein FlgL [Gammaproteobacteria bacterium]
MRISTLQMNQQGVNGMLDISQQVTNTQKQISSGKRIATPSDDPVGAARVIKINQELAIRGQYRSNIDAAEAQLAQEETVLQQVLNVMQRIRELSLQASNGVQTNDDRRYTAIEIEARFDELVSLVNTRGPSGEYLFSGFQGDVQPFVVDGQSVTFQGDEGQRKVQVDGGQFVAINDSGREIFMDVESASPVFAVRSHPDNDPLSNAGITAGPIVDRDAVAAFFPDDLVIEFRPLSEDPTGQPNYTVRRRSDNRVVEGLQNIPHTPNADIQAQGMSIKISGQPQPGDRFFVETSNKQDLLTTVRNIATGLVSMDPVTAPEAFEFLVGDTLTGLDNAMDSILEVQAQIGARLNAVE